MANIRIYNGDAIGQNTLSADWLNRRLASGAEGCGFDPRLAYQLLLAISQGGARPPENSKGRSGKLERHFFRLSTLLLQPSRLRKLQWVCQCDSNTTIIVLVGPKHAKFALEDGIYEEFFA